MSPEIVYINGGEIYKQSMPEPGPRFVVNGVESTYRPPYEGEVDSGEIARYVAEKTHADGRVSIKRYRATSQIREMMKIGGGVAVDPALACPAISLWLAVATYDDDPEFCELYFRAESGHMLDQVASFYQLPNPVTADMAANFERNPWEWGIKVLGLGGAKEPIIAASVAFRKGTPYLFKLYRSWAASRHPESPLDGVVPWVEASPE